MNKTCTYKRGELMAERSLWSACAARQTRAACAALQRARALRAACACALPPPATHQLHPMFVNCGTHPSSLLLSLLLR